MSKIYLENMEFYAFHGCFAEEQVIGNQFLVNAEIEVNTEESERTDNLGDTLNYQEVYQYIDKEMQQKSKLLENVARRIVDRLRLKFPAIESIRIKISKMHPPMGGKMQCVSVELEKHGKI